MIYEKSSIIDVNIKITILCIIYMLTLQWIYMNLIVTRYGYYGFEGDFNTVRCIISWLFLIPVPHLINSLRKKETISNIFLSIILFLNYIPMLVLNIYMNLECIYLFILYYIILFIIILKMPEIKFCIKNSKKISSLKYDSIVKIIGIFVAIIIIFIWIYYSHFNIEIGFGNVYEQRREARNYTMPVVIKYIFNMGKAIIPLLAIYCLYMRRRLSFIFYSIIQIITFFIDGTKSTFFLLICGIALYKIIQYGNKIILMIPIIFAGINISCILEKFIMSTTNINDFIIRRMMFVPCRLSEYYYDYFSENGIDYYRQSLGIILGDSKYELSIPRLIGKVCFNDPDMAANNGLFADAYANLGVIGVIILPIMIVFVLKIMEGVAHYLPKEIYAVTAIQASVAFISSSFFTTLLTHGIAFSIIMLYILCKCINSGILRNEYEILEKSENIVKCF